ncbi:recombinase RecT [Blautia stercoris]
MALQNSLQNQTQNQGLSAYLTNDAVRKRINDVVGGKDEQRFISSIVSAVNANESLKECTPQSIFSAALLGESLKLSPSPQLGQYYLVPFNGKEKGKNAQFQLGYKGYIQLAIRSGQYKKLNVLAIKDGELVRFDPLTEEIEVNLIEDEEVREEAKTTGYYAMFEYTNGFRKAIYWSKKKMEAHAKKYSKSYCKSSSVWQTNFDAMAYKTMLRQLISKWGIMSIDMVSALDADMAVINEDGTKNYVDNASYTESNKEDVIEVKEVKVEQETEIPGQMDITDFPDVVNTENKAKDPRAALFGN